MTGILDGLRVLDLSTGIAGPMTTMLLADHGADVVRVEPPDGDPERDRAVVWHRGKVRVALDLATDRDEFGELARRADVLVETFRPGVTDELGIDAESLLAANPRLVYASITGYGRDTAAALRPAIEWLVTARTGLQWDQRGWYGTRMDHIMGTDLDEPGFAVPDGVDQLGCREGPIFLAVPWASIGATLLATTAISAGLYVAERTGRGQHVETSLAQACIMMNAMGWQRVARMHPSYRLWYFDRRAPKGVFRAGDGRWLHQWAPFAHEFLRANAIGAEGTEDAAGAGKSPRPTHLGAADYEAAVRYQAEAFVETARAVATRPCDEWVRLAAEAGVGLQPILSPEEALLDEPLEREGVIVEIDDPEHGPIRQVGHVHGFDGVPNPPIRPRAADVTAVAAVTASWPAVPPVTANELPAAPLSGVLVLDLGLAIAGPFGTQMLADLGATVIKITTREFDLTDAIYVGSSHGKQALALDLKHPRGRDIAHRLIARADVVHHNMRTGVAERLGIGYEQARAINPQIIYCHTRGFERDGPRTPLPGNDQLGNALAGTQHEAGGTHHGTAPIWHMTAFGDTGNGILSAAAVVQALRHRERTGQGQFVHTSILNACMLFNSYAWIRPDGSGPERDRIDTEQYGFSALQRLYETADGWLCVFATSDAEWVALCEALEAHHLATDERFADAGARRANDPALATELGAVLAAKDAGHWFAVLDAAGVPCEVASSTFARELFDDPDMHARGWVVHNAHEHLGTVDHVGMPWSFSLTAAQNLAGSPVTGQHSRAILRRLGYTDGEIDELVAEGAVGGVDVNVDLSGKVAVVTGGSRGLGREMVLGFARAGADVVISSRKLDACEELAAVVTAETGRRALAVAAHAGRWDDVDHLVDVVYEELGRVDVLVNNAGMAPLYPRLSAVSEELFDKVIAVNLKGPFRLGALVGERMEAGAGGSIINISSIGAIHPTMTDLPYAAAKAGLNTLTTGFAVSFGPTVRSNGIMVGPFLTDISKAWDVPAYQAHARQRFPLQRLGEPPEIVGTALYLASDASSFTTGTIITVDGGVLASSPFRSSG